MTISKIKNDYIDKINTNKDRFMDLSELNTYFGKAFDIYKNDEGEKIVSKSIFIEDLKEMGLTFDPKKFSQLVDAGVIVSDLTNPKSKKEVAAVTQSEAAKYVAFVLGAPISELKNSKTAWKWEIQRTDNGDRRPRIVK